MTDLMNDRGGTLGCHQRGGPAPMHITVKEASSELANHEPGPEEATMLTKLNTTALLLLLGGPAITACDLSDPFAAAPSNDDPDRRAVSALDETTGDEAATDATDALWARQEQLEQEAAELQRTTANDRAFSDLAIDVETGRLTVYRVGGS